MIRLYVEHFEKDTVEMSPDQSHYLVSVMRVKSGDCIRIFNERNGEFDALVEIKKRTVFVSPLTCIKHMQTNNTKREIWLAFSPLKSNLTHFVIEKATELGATTIQPIISDYTQYRHFSVDKCKKIAIKATEQCERLDVPNIFEAQNFCEFIKTLPPIHWLAAIERTNASHISFDPAKISSVGIIVGPEGGFSEVERNMLTLSTTAISLGDRILRSETAALCALSIISLQIAVKDFIIK
ncbi:MAG: 16S rRNA (uracil(1498)-N(3))-methyltransferase [Holosporales bacterium]|nr:16S rRNA (uracil(1498)-N(3))-methyltransferase [Holosporales bacterium]